MQFYHLKKTVNISINKQMYNFVLTLNSFLLQRNYSDTDGIQSEMA